MAIVAVKVHPAIGVARLGNSPGEFFVGPEALWETPAPPGGFKDGECRVKRQAARFRVFAYHDDDTITELTAADAAITWTVHVANKKATHAGNAGSAAELTIDPGARTLNGPDQRQQFDTGAIAFPGVTRTVPLGEARTDVDGRLIVLGGAGHSESPVNPPAPLDFPRGPDWFDDVADGPVSAHVKLHAGGAEYDADGAWVIVAPPKFAPGLQTPVSLYDRVFEMARERSWVAGPAVPSYTADIYPILQRARDIHAVRGDAIGHHTWTDPVYDQTAREAVFNRLTAPGGGGGDMPDLADSGLTSVQYEVMRKWKEDNFTRDWVAPPQPAPQVTPDDLDRATLTNCVGAAFYPGIEAGGITDGGLQPIIDSSNYVGASDPLRLSHAALSPGDVTQWMSLPWQNDFFACQDSWWPVPRPDEVLRDGVPDQSWTGTSVPDNYAMVSKWSTLGFVVKQGDEYVEVERCETPFVALLTPHLSFQDVPQGPMGMSRKTALAIDFEVESSTAVSLEVRPGDRPGNARLTIPTPSVSVGPTASGAIAIARIWVEYETGPVGESISDQVTVTDAASGARWTITITANTVARKVAAAALVLDRSGSMSEDRGDGISKHDSVVEASSIMVDVMLEGDAIGVVAFNETAATLQGAATLGAAGDPLDPGRIATKSTVAGSGLAPAGSTSIGAGILKGREVLTDAGSGFDVKSLVVLTDGMENTPPWIADVAAQIDEFTYSVGLGTPQNTSAAALQAISGNHGGYLLLTGAVAADNRFILTKYFLQILAGISNAEIVLDPQGELAYGVEQEIPFELTEADTGVDVIVLTPDPELIDFRLRAPSGQVIDPSHAESGSDVAYSRGEGNAFYRAVLPQQLLPGRFDQPGTWKALLSFGKSGGPSRMQPAASQLPPRWLAQERASRAAGRTSSSAARRVLPYSLVVHAYSNLSFEATLHQSSYEPGTQVAVNASLSESGMPPRSGASVRAELTHPDGTHGLLTLTEVEPGKFTGSFATSQPGIYTCRIRARGFSRRGHLFRRERTLTAGVWYGGDRDPRPQASGGPDNSLCTLLRCLLDSKTISGELEQRLRSAGVDVEALRRCVEQSCASAGRDS